MEAKTVSAPPNPGNPLPGRDIISISQFDRADVDRIMRETRGMAQIVDHRHQIDMLPDVVVANLFYEPSTRTFLSFEAAAKRLGAQTISTQGVEFSSISKGESLQDTIATVNNYADTIVLRHKSEGSAAIAASVSSVPVINAGDGKAEHPTQALLDLYTIDERFSEIDGLTVTMIGDLKHGRTVHSLARLLSMYNVQLNYVSPEALAMPGGLVNQLNERVDQYETTDLGEVIGESDVLYVTRIQKERLDDPEEYERLKGSYVIDLDTMRRAKADMALMHPLPRVDEIDPAVDKDPRAAYFDQVRNGMYLRMGLLALVNGRSALTVA